MNPVSNPVLIEENREASLIFWGMELHTFDGTQGAAILAEWLHDMEILFILCHIGAHLALIILRFGLLPGEGPHMHYRDPEIYRDLNMRRYFTPPTTLEMTLDELIEAIMGAKVMAYAAQAAARAHALEDGDDYHPLSMATNDDDYHPLTPVDNAVNLEENMEYPTVIIIACDNKDGDEVEEKEDVEEILNGDDVDDEDVDSIIFSDISSE
ncbi:hypothetical protein TIFTF001_022406 [Ficus carica]|uniref:Uncharacterized protein n=1 Tax=Ficus carica TaxID=3494 RepID=A0AA88AHQ9_FICCA|nr:hypothetical protein TIFTF001_022406 [Ficus carica]